MESKNLSIKTLKPYPRGSRQVAKMKKGLPFMVLNDGIYLPLVRPAPNLPKGERDKPITITKQMPTKEGEVINQQLTISYSNEFRCPFS